MQLQRSFFSLYKVFVKKTHLLLWGLFALVFLLIISWQMGQFITSKPVYNFDQCMMQFFNLTRTMPNDTVVPPIQQNSTAINGSSNSTEQKKSGKKPFFLESSYYTFLNETSTIKLYLSDKIQYKQGQPNCQIILNTQKLRQKNSQQDNRQNDGVDQSKVTEKKTESQQTAKEVKILQQIQIEQSQKNQQQTQESKVSQKSYFTLAPTQLPENIRNYDQITDEQHQFLLNEHSFMHLTGNQHVAYLDQNNQFEERHNVQIHAIILSQQQFDEYPSSWLGISSKWWRVHGNQLITKNGNMLRSMGETFLAVSGKVKDIYARALFSVNLLIAVKKLNNETKVDQTERVEEKEKQGNLVKQQKRTENEQGSQKLKPQDTKSQQVDTKSQSEVNQTIIARETIKELMEELPNEIIGIEAVYPLSQLKLYFHYPQTLRIEDIGRLVLYVETQSSLLYKLFTVLVLYGSLFIISTIIGLLVRYLFFSIITIYLFMGGSLIHKQWAWVQKYYRLIKNRFTQQNAFISIKIILFFLIALLASLTVFTFGIKYILTNIVIFTMSFSEMYYAEMLLKNYFIIEMFYFIFCRSRTTLKYFPLYSLALTILILFANERFYCYHISWLMNMHLMVHMLLMSLFIGVENYIGNSEFHNEFTPSEEKPRALFYAAYDISWENTLPPIWTYFTTYFDWRYFGERQRVLINKDYQMLYGRLMGMNERQELPEDEENNEDENRELNENNLSQSNEMNLIR